MSANINVNVFSSMTNLDCFLAYDFLLVEAAVD